MRAIANLLTFLPLWFFCMRILSLPINWFRGIPLGYFGDPPVFEMYLSIFVAPVLMVLCNKRFNLGQAKTAFLFTVACYVLTISTFLLLNEFFLGTFIIDTEATM